MKGETAAALLALWFVFSAVYYVTASYTLAAIALAFTAGLAIASLR
jgi:hypothetical protein